MPDLITAAERFLAKLDECQPHIDKAFLHRNFRTGEPYEGPTYGEELDALREAVERQHRLAHANERPDDADSGFDESSLVTAEAAWVNLPTGRSWDGLATHEKALAVHTLARLRKDHLIGTPVHKRGGDYEFDGEIRAVIVKRSGAVRYAVEDERGLLLVMNAKQCGIEEPGQ